MENSSGRGTETAKGKISKSDLLDKLISYMSINTCFMYNSAAEMTSVPHNAKRTEDDVARAWAENVITPSDLYILYSIYLLSFATVEMVVLMLKILKKQTPERNIPVIEESAAKNRIIEMCQSGLVAGRKVSKDSKSKVVLYTCVHNGFRLLQMQMQGYIYADDMLLALNEMHTYERAASAYCAVIFASAMGDGCKDIQGFGEDRAFGRDYRPKLNAKVHLKNQEKEMMVAFEPIYYSCNPQIDIYEELIQRHRQRLRVMSRWAISCKTILHVEPKVVIVCENVEGLQKAAQFVRKEVSQLEPFVCYTSETIFREFRGSRIVRAGFIKPKFDETGLMIPQLEILL